MWYTSYMDGVVKEVYRLSYKKGDKLVDAGQSYVTKFTACFQNSVGYVKEGS